MYCIAFLFFFKSETEEKCELDTAGINGKTGIQLFWRNKIEKKSRWFILYGVKIVKAR